MNTYEVMIKNLTDEVQFLKNAVEAKDMAYCAAMAKYNEQVVQVDRLTRIVWCVVRNCQHVDDTTPRDEPGPLTGPTWHKVAYMCGLGSTLATALCLEFGVDPHSCKSEETP